MSAAELQKKKNLLKKVALFEGISEEDLDQLVPLLRFRKCVRGQSVVEVDMPGHSLYMISNGELKVTIQRDDKEAILTLLGAGDFFGEMALLDGKGRSANVVCLRASDLYELSREDFLRYVEAHPRALINILQHLTERLRNSNLIISNLTLLDVYGRVARFFMTLAEEEGEEVDAGILLRKPPSQQQMAGMLGTSRETVNRVIAEFVQQGILQKDGRQLVITSEALLAEQVQ
ncbi:MAG: Crp/Fnr family transcriptional regulator [Deltaproteobacteria bacterium]|nr:MAG: Crp/Fnr family transcriptional regulator [Deltaproteobacteria bacterium]